MPDTWSWLESNWPAAVQAAAAIVLGWLTYRLAKATDAYAMSAKQQVTEVVNARLIAIQPHMHVVAASRIHRHGDTDESIITVELKNLGTGPAIDVLGRLEYDRVNAPLELNERKRLAALNLLGEYHERRTIDSHTVGTLTPLTTVAAGDTHMVTFSKPVLMADLELSRGAHLLAEIGHQTVPTIELVEDLSFVGEYRDLAGNWWQTQTPRALQYTRQADGTYRERAVSFKVQDEQIRPIVQPTMKNAIAASGASDIRAYRRNLKQSL